MKKYSLVLFDLDSTLWDFEKNAEDALSFLFNFYQLHAKTNSSVHDFISIYQQINKSYWEKYEKGEITKEVLRTKRFSDVFDAMGIVEEHHPKDIWSHYLEVCSAMKNCLPKALETLTFISKNYPIGIITNGFEQTQNAKITSSGIRNHIKFMITSEAAGIAKPNIEIFQKALDLGNCKAEDAVYIGDNWKTDILGGTNAGIDSLWFNFNNNQTAQFCDSTHYLGEIHELLEIKNFL